MKTSSDNVANRLASLLIVWPIRRPLDGQPEIIRLARRPKKKKFVFKQIIFRQISFINRFGCNKKDEQTAAV